VQQQALDAAKATLRRHFEVLNQALCQHDWIAGDHRSIADPYLFVLTRWVRDKDVGLKGLDGLHEHLTRMQQDPEVQTALVEEGLKDSTQAARTEE
jgi:glutathione S-transferase